MSTTLRILCCLPLLWLATAASAISPGAIVSDFKLNDHTGKAHALHDSAEKQAIVLMVQGNGCPIVRHALPALKEVQAQYQRQGVEFLLLNSNLQDNRQTIAKEAREFSIAFPILVDEDQHVGEALGVVRTSEVFVIDPSNWTLVYRGPMDDRLSYERQRPARHHYLTDALDDLLADRPVRVAHAQGVGCLVNFPERGKKTTQPAAHSHHDHTGH